MDGAPFYGFGSLWMSWERRGDFQAEFRRLRQEHDFNRELKWTNAKERLHLPFHKAVIDWFFERKWIQFHALVIRKADVDKSLHGGDYDLARRKHFTMLLSNKIQRVLKRYPEDEHEFRIWADPIASRYSRAGETVEIITQRAARQTNGKVHIKLFEHDSAKTPAIQVCDLLLGAVLNGWRRNSTNKTRAEVAAHIADHLGWQDLSADTFRTARKFNVWGFHDPTKGERAVASRAISCD